MTARAPSPAANATRFVEPLRTSPAAKFQVTDAGLVRFKDFKNLAVIDLKYSSVTARGLEHLKGMSSLKRLVLAGTLITDGELEPFRQAMPNVTVRK